MNSPQVAVLDACALLVERTPDLLLGVAAYAPWNVAAEVSLHSCPDFGAMRGTGDARSQSRQEIEKEADQRSQLARRALATSPGMLCWGGKDATVEGPTGQLWRELIDQRIVAGPANDEEHHSTFLADVSDHVVIEDARQRGAILVTKDKGARRYARWAGVNVVHPESGRVYEADTPPVFTPAAASVEPAPPADGAIVLTGQCLHELVKNNAYRSASRDALRDLALSHPVVSWWDIASAAVWCHPHRWRARKGLSQDQAEVHARSYRLRLAQVVNGQPLTVIIGRRGGEPVSSNIAIRPMSLPATAWQQVADERDPTRGILRRAAGHDDPNLGDHVAIALARHLQARAAIMNAELISTSTMLGVNHIDARHPQHRRPTTDGREGPATAAALEALKRALNG